MIDVKNENRYVCRFGKGHLSAAKLIILPVLALLLTSSACRRPRVDEATEPRIVKTITLDSLNSIVLDNLREKRVVMLPDAQHGLQYYMNRVVSFLDYWIGQAGAHSADRSYPRNLILCLEMPETLQKLLEEYFSTGDRSPYISAEYRDKIEVGNNALTMDEIEFVQSLRMTNTKIRIWNSSNPGIRLQMQVVGPEPSPPYEPFDEYVIGRERFDREKNEWFAMIRDRLIASRIEQALKENHDTKMLLFYGEAHLSRRLSLKAGGDGKFGPPLYDYWLAHFLDSTYGRSQVAVFQQSGTTYQRDGKPRTNYVNELEPGSGTPDYRIYSIAPLTASRPFEFFKSRWVLGVIFDGMQKHSQDTSLHERHRCGSYTTAFLRFVWHSYLAVHPRSKSVIDSLLSCAKKRVNDLSITPCLLSLARSLMEQFDAVENIRETDRWLLSTNVHRDSVYYLTMLDDVSMSLPPEAGLHPSIGRQIKQESHVFDSDSTIRLELIRRIADIKLYSLMNVLLIATDREKVKIISQLQQSTGLKYNGEEGWRRWWDSKYRP